MQKIMYKGELAYFKQKNSTTCVIMPSLDAILTFPIFLHKFRNEKTVCSRQKTETKAFYYSFQKPTR